MASGVCVECLIGKQNKPGDTGSSVSYVSHLVIGKQNKPGDTGSSLSWTRPLHYVARAA
jgi:hypothetical protein